MGPLLSHSWHCSFCAQIGKPIFRGARGAEVTISAASEGSETAEPGEDMLVPRAGHGGVGAWGRRLPPDPGASHQQVGLRDGFPATALPQLPKSPRREQEDSAPGIHYAAALGPSSPSSRGRTGVPQGALACLGQGLHPNTPVDLGGAAGPASGFPQPPGVKRRLATTHAPDGCKEALGRPGAPLQGQNHPGGGGCGLFRTWGGHELTGNL